MPVLWDRGTGRIVSNESAEILRMLNSAFDEWGGASLDLHRCTTLIRFDAVCVGHFTCNLRLIVDHSALRPYLREPHQEPGVAETVDVDPIERHYHLTHDAINPTGIVPKGPALDLSLPHGRG